MKYLFWDIDGTLLLTGGAGANAMLDVIKDYYFLKEFSFQKSLAGRTDSEIIREAVMQVKGKFRPADAASLLIRYHMKLPQYLPKYQGRILKNVESTLSFFANKPEQYTNCLLTGNTKTAAKYKLDYYNLSRFFDFNKSVFGEISEDRTELAKVAWQRLYSQNPHITPENFVFIGDTPSDVLCAQAIDAKSIVILEGSNYRAEDFSPVAPDVILDQLPDDPSALQALFEK